MILFGLDCISEFANAHPDAESPLKSWRKMVETGAFKHLVDLKQSFGSVDYVKPYTVFDIGGNKYRLISRVSYESETVGIMGIYTHSEYDQGKWRKL